MRAAQAQVLRPRNETGGWFERRILVAKSNRGSRSSLAIHRVGHATDWAKRAHGESSLSFSRKPEKRRQARSARLNRSGTFESCCWSNGRSFTGLLMVVVDSCSQWPQARPACSRLASLDKRPSVASFRCGGGDCSRAVPPRHRAGAEPVRSKEAHGAGVAANQADQCTVRPWDYWV